MEGPEFTYKGRGRWVMTKNTDDPRTPLEAARDNDTEAQEWADNDADWHPMEESDD